MAQQDQPNRTPLEDEELIASREKTTPWSDVSDTDGDAPPGGQSFGERIGEDEELSDEQLADAAHRSDEDHTSEDDVSS